MCRTKQKAEVLCSSLGQGSEVAELDKIRSGEVSGDILINTTSVGMQPNEEQSPIPKEALQEYTLVFDAVYTPLKTTLLKVSVVPPKSLQFMTCPGVCICYSLACPPLAAKTLASDGLVEG